MLGPILRGPIATVGVCGFTYFQNREREARIDSVVRAAFSELYGHHAREFMLARLWPPEVRPVERTVILRRWWVR